MKAEIKNGKLLLDVYQILDSLSIEEKIKFVESIACYGDVINYVTDQITYGCTENGYAGSETYRYHTYSSGLNLARRKILSALTDIMQKEYESWNKTIKDYETRIDQLVQERYNR